jgi:hypothetical protein
MGKLDLVLMLAVIHHLILREQVPLGHIGGSVREADTALAGAGVGASRGPDVSGVAARSRRPLRQLSEEDLRQAFAPFFHVLERRVLGNQRVLLLFERNERGEAGREADGQAGGA